MILFDNRPEVNIGLVGHVDHGKTSLTQALTGKWTDTHSEEIKRGITIRLGYADATFYICRQCHSYGTTPTCACGSSAEPRRAVSFIDAPGHETLMATVLSGATLMDGALLLTAANETCPQPQTAEHLKALDIVGIKNIVIVQNKVDLVTTERCREHYQEIKTFVKGTVAENAPVIPISAVHRVNIDKLIEAIQETITTPQRDEKAEPVFYIARSFDINPPGTAIDGLQGGVIGGSLVSGVLRVGDTIDIRPGALVEKKWTTLTSTVHSIMQAGERQEARPGGLVALQTGLDPSFVKGDLLAGNIGGRAGKLPDVASKLSVRYHLFDHVIGVGGNAKVKPLKTGDALMLTVAIAKTVGIIESARQDVIEIGLKLPVCANKGNTVSLSMQVGGRWHLVGWGEII